LPFDNASLLTITGAGACLLAAVWMRRRPRVSLLFIMAAALLIRVDPARQWSLHAWDEQLHAVVGRHLVDHPLTPTLYERPVVPPDPRQWTENHVWLHKPPLTMWMMAASLATFGVSAFVVRLPSIVLSTLGVGLVYLVGRKLYGERVGLLAAGFQAVNSLLVNLASGRRVCDHVDTVLIACVQAGATVVLTTSLAEKRWLPPLLTGVAMGAGLLAKSAPALLVGGLAAVMWFDRRSVVRSFRPLAVMVIAAVVVAAPWMVSARLRFPAESAAGFDVILAHITTVLDEAGGPWWRYIAEMPRYFGELVYVPVVWFVAWRVRRSTGRSEWALLAWLSTPYLVFSVMPTKLPGFIAIAAPALFVVQAAFWFHLRDSVKHAAGPLRIAAVALLTLLLLLPARALLEPQGPFERRDRQPASSLQMMSLEAELNIPDAVIFNMPRALEAMFYSPYTAYSRMPRPPEVEELRRRAIPIVIFVPAGTSPPAVPDDWNARYLAEAVPPRTGR
jgi:4-amino-4-deoxy-L-arabinose transferase-like glycosyltransferase